MKEPRGVTCRPTTISGYYNDRATVGVPSILLIAGLRGNGEQEGGLAGERNNYVAN